MTIFIRNSILLFIFLNTANQAIYAQANRYWVGTEAYINNFQSAADLAQWTLVEDNGTGGWSLTTRGTAILKMDNASGGYANRLFNVVGSSGNLLPLDSVNGKIEFQVVALTGGNQRFFVQAQQFTAGGTYISQVSVLTAHNSVGYYPVNLNTIHWASNARQIRFMIGGENYSANQGTVEFNYFSYSNTNLSYSNRANWSASSGGAGGAVLPGIKDTAIFDNGGNANCYLDTAFVPAKFLMQTTYPGSFIQAAYTVSVGAGGMVIKGGDFSGGTAAISTKSINISSGNFTATAGTTIITGDLSFTGGSFIHNSGTISFSGSVAQVWANTASGIYKNITIANSAGVSLNDDAGISGSLIMSSGLLFASTHTIDLGLTGTLSETGTNPSSYVSGIIKATRNIGTTVTLQTFGGIGLDISESSQSASPVTVTRYIGAANITNSADALKRSFEISAPGSTYTASMKFHYFTSELNGINTSILKLYSTALPYSSSTAIWTKISCTVDTVLNIITTTGVSAFGRYTGAPNVSPLPVTLIEFTSEPFQHNAMLSWTTALEINNSFFQLEKSRDGTLFEAISRISGAGNSNKLLQYKYMDENTYAGTSYYRLKQVDYNGISEYSKIISFKKTAVSLPVIMFPNPLTTGALHIILPETPASAVELGIFNISGAKVYTNIIKSESATLPPIYLNLSSGMYALQIMVKGEMWNEKLYIK